MTNKTDQSMTLFGTYDLQRKNCCPNFVYINLSQSATTDANNRNLGKQKQTRSLISPSIDFKKCHLIESHFQHDSGAVVQSEHSHLTLLFASMAREGRENELLICKWIGSH